VDYKSIMKGLVSPGKENSLHPTGEMDIAMDTSDTVNMKGSPAHRAAETPAVTDEESPSKSDTPTKTPRKNKRSDISVVRSPCHFFCSFLTSLNPDQGSIVSENRTDSIRKRQKLQKEAKQKLEEERIRKELEAEAKAAERYMVFGLWSLVFLSLVFGPMVFGL
jgi:hypothetical protein